MGFTVRVLHTEGRLAQLARASRLHREGRGFESLSAHTGFLYVRFDWFCSVAYVHGFVVAV